MTPPRRRLPAMDARPIGVFDSGMGGLTVLHECLVTLPHEDFVYLGDGARLPYGPRPLDEIRRFAAEVGGYLERQGVKLVVAACNSATAAALPDLQRRLSVPVVGVLAPEAHAAVLATRNRRIGLLATEATVASGRYAELVHALDAGVELVAGRVPAARPADRGRRPVRRGDDRGGARVRGAAAGGGRRHGHPRLHALPADPPDLPARLRARRDARLLGGGDRARGRGDARPQGDRERRLPRGRVPLPDDGRAGAFREMGRRFLQLPIAAAEHVEVAALEAAAA